MYNECKDIASRKILNRFELKLACGYAYTGMEEEATKLVKECYEELQKLYEDKNDLKYISALSNSLTVCIKCGLKDDALKISNEAKVLAEKNSKKNSNL